MAIREGDHHVTANEHDLVLIYTIVVNIKHRFDNLLQDFCNTIVVLTQPPPPHHPFQVTNEVFLPSHPVVPLTWRHHSDPFHHRSPNCHHRNLHIFEDFNSKGRFDIEEVLDWIQIIEAYFKYTKIPKSKQVKSWFTSSKLKLQFGESSYNSTVEGKVNVLSKFGERWNSVYMIGFFHLIRNKCSIKNTSIVGNIIGLWMLT